MCNARPPSSNKPANTMITTCQTIDVPNSSKYLATMLEGAGDCFSYSRKPASETPAITPTKAAPHSQPKPLWFCCDQYDTMNAAPAVEEINQQAATATFTFAFGFVECSTCTFIAAPRSFQISRMRANRKGISAIKPIRRSAPSASLRRSLRPTPFADFGRATHVRLGVLRPA